MTELKRNELLSFDDGLLTVKVSGHGQANGWGELAFHERQSELDADGFHHFEIPPSELCALRDFLNRIIPPSEKHMQISDATRNWNNMEADMQITVNGVRHDIPRAPITYSCIAGLAGHPDAKSLTVTYRGQRKGDWERSGTLIHGEQIEPDDGLIFAAVFTG